MDRRTFIVALFALYGCGQKEEPEKSAEASKSAPEAAEASKSAPEAAGVQQTGKGYRIGFLGPANASSWARYIAALRQGLRELGYEATGQDFLQESRSVATVVLACLLGLLLALVLIGIAIFAWLILTKPPGVLTVTFHRIQA